MHFTGFILPELDVRLYKHVLLPSTGENVEFSLQGSETEVSTRELFKLKKAKNSEGLSAKKRFRC
jgi:hypothetical protein